MLYCLSVLVVSAMFNRSILEGVELFCKEKKIKRRKINYHGEYVEMWNLIESASNLEEG